MKEYKGWEIVKMLDEKILKVGDRFKSRTGIYEVAETSSDTLYLKTIKSDNETGNSILSDPSMKFTKIQKPLTFFEAMAKADEGEKVTNSYVLDGIEKDDLPKGYWYKGSKGILVWHDIEDCDDKYDVYLVDKELQSNWYIYEE